MKSQSAILLSLILYLFSFQAILITSATAQNPVNKWQLREIEVYRSLPLMTSNQAANKMIYLGLKTIIVATGVLTVAA